MIGVIMKGIIKPPIPEPLEIIPSAIPRFRVKYVGATLMIV